MITLISESHPRARKRHRCDWCDGAILPGEIYHRRACAGDGTAWTWRAHPECDQALDDLSDWSDEYPRGVLTDGYYDDDELPEWWREWRASRAAVEGA